MSEHTIAENLVRLTTARTNIANAITAKGGTVNSGDGFEEFPADIATIPSDGQRIERNDVNFYDYDGTITNSYTASEFAGLDAMPDNPSHEGLTSQGWNWALADAKAYVAKYGKLDVGQLYKTDDGALRLYIRLEDGRLSPVLGICLNGTATVDWGDNSSAETMTGSSTDVLVYLAHTYATPGDYVISLIPSVESEIVLGQRDGNSTILCKAPDDSFSDRRMYLNSIYKVELPDSLTSISTYAFQNCHKLAAVSIPSNVTSISSYAFRYCYVLPFITIPDGVASIDGYCFLNCYGLSAIAIPNSVTSIATYAFQNCTGFLSIIIPDGVTSIAAYALRYCYGLLSITIPDSVTSIGRYVFQSCKGIGFIKFTSPIPPTVVNVDTWDDIATDCILYVPDGYLEDYLDATNLPDPDVFQYVEY